MKKKSILIISLSIMAVGTLLGVRSSCLHSDLRLEANLEALSDGEGSGTCCNQVGATCYVAGFPKQEGAYYISNGPC